MKNIPQELVAEINQAKKAVASRDVAIKSLRCLDLTSLNDKDARGYQHLDGQGRSG